MIDVSIFILTLLTFMGATIAYLVIRLFQDIF